MSEILDNWKCDKIKDNSQKVRYQLIIQLIFYYQMNIYLKFKN